MTSFEMSRRIVVEAPPERVHPLIDDFHAWRRWSPWEDVDPDLQRTYSGAERGVGAHYRWSGNKKAGEGTMEITGSDPRGIVVALAFLKPFKATNTLHFDLRPAGSGTEVIWSMKGERNPVMAIAGRLYFDKAVGKDFDRGLVRLKAEAEAGGATG